MARHYRVNKNRKGRRGIKTNVKIIFLEATFKTVLVGGRTDMSRETVPDGRSSNWERSVTKFGPCAWRCVIRTIRGTGVGAVMYCSWLMSRLHWCMPDRNVCAINISSVTLSLMRNGIGSQCSSWRADLTWSRGGGPITRLGSCILHALQWDDGWPRKTDQDGVAVVKTTQDERWHELLHYSLL